jgi:hypothetical protein
MAKISCGQLGLCLLIATATLPGCMGDVGDPSELEGVETVDETELGLHEDACWTQATPHRVVAAPPQVPSWWPQYMEVSSPDAAYTAAGCPNQWIVDFTNTSGRLFVPYAVPPDLFGATSKVACEGYWALMRAKAYEPNLCRWPPCTGGRWVDLGGRRYGGSWNDEFGTCDIVSDAPGIHVEPPHRYQKVRIVVQAGWALAYARAAAALFIQ